MEEKGTTQKIKTSPSPRNAILIIGIIFIAFNLRPAITSVGPLISQIREDLAISNSMAGMITTLPLLAFAVFSLIAPKIGRALGNEMTIFISILILFTGIMIRSVGSVWLLFIGTGLIGIGIASANVLLPAIVKQSYPLKVGIMTSIYSSSMGLCAATASGVSVPLATGLGLGWQKALLVWGVIAGLGAILWYPQVMKSRTVAGMPAMGLSAGHLLHSRVAWQLTFFMGLQSLLFYGPIAWLPQILVDKGLTVATAGWMLSLMQFTSLPANFITPMIAGKLKDQRPIMGVIGLCYLTSLTVLILGGNHLLLIIGVMVLGVAQGASISLALLLFSLRSTNATEAAQLSGMAQAAGYLLAAIGPILIGYLFDYYHSWTYPLLFLLLTAIGVIISGLGAARNVYVGNG